MTGTASPKAGDLVAITRGAQKFLVPLELIGSVDSATGKILQVATTFDGTRVSGTFPAIPQDNTIPQITEGGAGFSAAAFTPVNLASTLLLEVLAFGSVDAGTSPFKIALFETQFSATDAILFGQINEHGDLTQVSAAFELAANFGTPPYTFQLRFGGNSAGIDVTLNGTLAGALYGGAMRSMIRITEIAP